MAQFSIHPQLVTDCHALGRLGLSHVLLHRNGALPWFILVPETGVTELCDLPSRERSQLMSEADAIARFTRQYFGTSKLNVAAIGNLVPQLHVHVVGRHSDDPCWPQPVWGNLPAGPAWPADRLSRIVAALRDRLELRQDILQPGA